MSDDNFMLHIMGNLPEKCETVLTDLENRLMTESSDKLTICMHQKLNAHFKRLENKREEDAEEEKALSEIQKRLNEKVMSSCNVKELQ